VDSALGTFHSDKQPENLCSYLQSTLNPSQNQAIMHHDRFAVAVLQGDSAVGHIPLRVFKSCLVLPEAWRRDHLRNHWQTKVGSWWQGSGGSMRYTFLGKPKWSNECLKLLLVKETAIS